MEILYKDGQSVSSHKNEGKDVNNEAGGMVVEDYRIYRDAMRQCSSYSVLSKMKL